MDSARARYGLRLFEVVHGGRVVDLLFAQFDLIHLRRQPREHAKSLACEPERAMHSLSLSLSLSFSRRAREREREMRER